MLKKLQRVEGHVLRLERRLVTAGVQQQHDLDLICAKLAFMTFSCPRTFAQAF